MTAFFRFPNSSSPYNIWSLSSYSSSSSPSRAATPSNLVTLSSSLRLGCYLHPRVEKLRPLLCAYFQEFYQSCRFLNINKFLTGRPLKRCSSLESLVGSFLATGKSWLCNYSGEISGKDHEGKREPHHKSASGKPFDGRLWTNIFLALNVLVYAAQLATGGRLMLLGAKVNSLINEGQIWRLATSAFLHANAVHLMVNCYSLNSVGPTVERFSGPKRYIAIYLTSAIACNLMSYWFCQSPSVGASGAIFGLVGSLALFSLRHRSLVNAPQGDLLQIGQVIVVNMLIGLSMKGIDNWGHVGGFLGGIAASWLLGPSWRFEIRKDDGRRVITDRAPIFSLIKRKRT